LSCTYNVLNNTPKVIQMAYIRLIHFMFISYTFR